MSATRNRTHESSDVLSTRSLSEISEVETVRLSVDLVSASRKNLGLLRTVSESPWLHERATILEAIRRWSNFITVRAYNCNLTGWWMFKVCWFFSGMMSFGCR
jgi:hypothetical protein